MPNSIEYTKRYTTILDEVYQRSSVSGCLTSPRHMVREGRNAREILIPRVNVTGLGDYKRNVGYATGAIEWSFESHSPDYDRGIKLNCFVAAGAELQRTQVAPEADAYTFSKIAGFEGVTGNQYDFYSSTAEELLSELRTVTNLMDEKQVDTGSRILFITPTLNGTIQDFSAANPNRSNRVMERFSRVVEVPQVRFYTKIDLRAHLRHRGGLRQDVLRAHRLRGRVLLRGRREPHQERAFLLLRADRRGRAQPELHGGGEIGDPEVGQARRLAHVLAGRA